MAAKPLNAVESLPPPAVVSNPASIAPLTKIAAIEPAPASSPATQSPPSAPTNRGEPSHTDADLAAANATYKGKVWRHLQRFKSDNLTGSGSAMVGFALESHGKLTALSLVKGSGSSNFDSEALQMVRRAQPFPPPPADISPSFQFEIKGN